MHEILCIVKHLNDFLCKEVQIDSQWGDKAHQVIDHYPFFQKTIYMNRAEEQNEQLAELCKQFGVKRLHAFGSYAANKLVSSSDIDLIVEFERKGYVGAFDQFMDLKEGLEQVFKRKIDLLTAKRFRNPVFAEEVERTKKLIYAT